MDLYPALVTFVIFRMEFFPKWYTDLTGRTAVNGRFCMDACRAYRICVIGFINKLFFDVFLIDGLGVIGGSVK